MKTEKQSSTTSRYLGLDSEIYIGHFTWLFSINIKKMSTFSICEAFLYSPLSTVSLNFTLKAKNGTEIQMMILWNHYTRLLKIDNYYGKVTIKLANYQ